MKNKLINIFYFWVGIPFLILAKIKNTLVGYTPKPFSTGEALRCAEYDINVVENWLKQLTNYQPTKDINNFIKNKTVLELGPGSDLGIGLYLLSRGAEKYYAVDVYDMASANSPDFYNVFFSHLENKNIETGWLKEELTLTQKGERNKLNFICNKNFDIVEALGGEKIDLVFSNAAFEHFNDVAKTIEDVTKTTSANAILVLSVDLITHSRWIRAKDPNNIYRYPQWLYKLLTTKSSPNRVRPYEFEEILKKNGWKNIVIVPLDEQKNDPYNSNKSLNKRFRDPKNQMTYQTIGICATK